MYSYVYVYTQPITLTRSLTHSLPKRGMKDALINSHLMPSHMINFIKFAITLTLAGIIQHWHLSVASMSWHSRKCSMSMCVCASCFIFVSISFPIYTNFSIWFGLVLFGTVCWFVLVFSFFSSLSSFTSNTFITFV